MKQLIATAAVLMVAAVPIGAGQDVSQGVSDQARQRLEQLKDRLQLTPEQIEQVRPVLVEEIETLKALRDKSGSGQSRRDRLKTLREARDIQNKTDEQLKKILSKPQMEEMKKMREQGRQQLRNRSGQP